jgi:hypothetical protein
VRRTTRGTAISRGRGSPARAAQAYDGDAATNELRSGPAPARLAAAAALKAAGNAALQAAPGGAPAAEQALQQYTKALSLLRYFGARLSAATAATSP